MCPRTFHWFFFGLVLLGGCSWFAGSPDETLLSDEQFLEQVRVSEEAATAWFLQNSFPDDFFTYEYQPVSDRLTPANNAIRQFMAARLLAEMSWENSDLLELHRRNLDFLFTSWYRETPNQRYGYIFEASKSKLGGNAMALRTLAISPYFEEYRAEAQKLAAGILSLQHADGSFDPWFVAPQYAYDSDYLLTFYSGEAILALIEYAERSDQGGYLDAAKKSQEFYLDKYVRELRQNYYPAYAPWHTLALNALYQITAEEKYAKAVFTLNDELLKIQDTTDHIGRFYNPEFPQYGNPHVASDGVYTEGLAYAYEMAKLRGDSEHQRAYGAALKRSLFNLQKLQYTPENIPPEFQAEKLLGAFRTSAKNSRIRIDNTQHTLDAYRKILQIYP